MVGHPGDKMKLRLQEGLLYTTVTLCYRGKQMKLENVLLDTGSAGTVFSADKVMPIGLEYEVDDDVKRIRGVGGSEFVFSKQLESVALGDLVVRDFRVEIGAMDYGIELDGIIGTDFLLRVGAIIDLARLKIYRSS